MARCCTRCGARLTYATTPYDLYRSVEVREQVVGAIDLMTPSEEMIPHQLRFKIASHGRTADWANQLFKFGGWNRVAESCRELGRLKKWVVVPTARPPLLLSFLKRPILGNSQPPDSNAKSETKEPNLARHSQKIPSHTIRPDVGGSDSRTRKRKKIGIKWCCWAATADAR